MKKIQFAAILVVLLVATFSFALADQTGQYDGGIVVDQDNPTGNISIDVGPSGSGEYVPYCGDGIVNLVSEYCDGSDLGILTCASAGSGYTGTPSCYANSCTPNYNSCVAPTTTPTTPTTSSGGGGGGGGGSSCVENWTCSDWETCTSGVQTRTCTDSKKCSTAKLKPLLQRDCSVEGEEGDVGIGLPKTEENVGFWSGITGAVIGTTVGRFSLVLIIFLIVLGLAWWIIAAKKRKADKVVVKKK